MKKYIVYFANNETEEIKAVSYNNAIKAANKLAAAKKTIVISVTESHED